MTINEYFLKQDPARKDLLSSIHEIILKTNKKVSAEIAPMMGSDMIQYKCNNQFVYALAGTKNYMSLHLLPMYASKPIHEKYSKLLKKAKVQKGCINFKNADEMPLGIAEQLLMDCAKIDMEAVMEKYKKKKK